MLARTPSETAKERLDRVMAEAVAKLGPMRPMPPRRPIGGGDFLAEPCSTPRERYMHYHTPLCMCGYAMGEHKTGGVK